MVGPKKPGISDHLGFSVTKCDMHERRSTFGLFVCIEESAVPTLRDLFQKIDVIREKFSLHLMTATCGYLLAAIFSMNV